MAGYRFPGEHMYENMVLESAMKDENIEKIKDIEIEDGDILVASYPKTGTTWIQEVTWLVTNNADVETAKTTRLTNRMLFLEFVQNYHNDKAGVDILKTIKRPVIMKTLVSLYHFYRMNSGLGNFQGSWDEFFELCETKHVLDGDFFDWYDSWLAYADNTNVQFYKYEDMKAEMPAVIKRLSNFLGTNMTEEQVKAIVEHTSFSTMKANKMVNNDSDASLKNDISPFIRKGDVGDWKNYFSDEQSRIIDERYKERLEQKGMILKFELP